MLRREEAAAKDTGPAEATTRPATRTTGITAAELLKLHRNLPADRRNPAATRILEEMVAREKARATATQPAEGPTGISTEDLLNLQRSLPPEDQNPIATRLLEDMLEKEQAGKAGAATQPAKKKPPISNQELLDYLFTLPEEKRNPLAVKMLQDLIAKEKADEEAAAAQAAASTTQPVTTKPTPAPEPTKPEPAAQATIYRLLLNQKEGKTYACLADGDLIYELEDKVYEDATAEMHDRQIAKFEVDDVIELTLGSGEREITFRKSEDDWKYAADPVLPIDNQKVKDVLEACKDLKTHRYVDYTASDLGRYGLSGDDVRRLAVAVQGGERIDIRLSKTGPEGDPDDSVYAVLAGSKEVFLLKEEQVEKFTKKLEDFEKAQ
jgi:hypothetical protein